MSSKSVFPIVRPSDARHAVDADAGTIVFLMLALVFLPIIAAHAAVLWQDNLLHIAPQHIAAVLGTLLTSLR